MALAANRHHSSFGHQKGTDLFQGPIISFSVLMGILANEVNARYRAMQGPTVSASTVLECYRGPTNKAALKTPLSEERVVHAVSGNRSFHCGDWKDIDRLGSGGFSEPKRVVPGDGQPTGQFYFLDTDLGEPQNVFRTIRNSSNI